MNVYMHKLCEGFKHAVRFPCRAGEAQLRGRDLYHCIGGGVGQTKVRGEVVRQVVLGTGGL